MQFGGGLVIHGTATLSNTNVYENVASGLYVDNGGVANLDGCTVFSNEAYVRPPYAPSLSLLQRPAEVALFLACAQRVAAQILTS